MEIIEKINQMLLEVNSIAQVEKLLGYGKDTLRKKLNRQGYKFNKETRQYEFVGVEDPGVKVKSEKVKQSPKQEIAQVVTDSYTPKVYEYETRFTDSQIDILHRMIKEYELKERISLVAEDKGELGNRNVRVYVEHFNKFSNWCKSMNMTQADGLYEAINMLMKQYQ